VLLGYTYTAHKSRSSKQTVSKTGKWSGNVPIAHIPYYKGQDAICGERLVEWIEPDSIEHVRVCRTCISRFEASVRKGDPLHSRILQAQLGQTLLTGPQL